MNDGIYQEKRALIFLQEFAEQNGPKNQGDHLRIMNQSQFDDSLSYELSTHSH